MHARLTCVLAASTSKLFSYMSVTAWIGVKYLLQSGETLLVTIVLLINITMTRWCGDLCCCGKNNISIVVCPREIALSGVVSSISERSLFIYSCFAQ